MLSRREKMTEASEMRFLKLCSKCKDFPYDACVDSLNVDSQFFPVYQYMAADTSHIYLGNSEKPSMQVYVQDLHSLSEILQFWNGAV